MKSFEVIVVGLGAYGSASLYQLAKRGVAVLGLDRFIPPHTHGSSHGESRITRLVTAEGQAYVPVVRRSQELWREIELETGKQLFDQRGVLFISSGNAKMFERVRQVAQAGAIPHETLSGAQIRQRFPQFRLDDDAAGLFDPQGGAVFPERCIEAQLQLAGQHGAQFSTGEIVQAVQPQQHQVRVVTNLGSYSAERVVLAGGAWLPKLLGESFTHLLRVYRQVLFWFAPRGDSKSFAPEHFPVFIWSHDDTQRGFYGFPSYSLDGSIKLATSQLQRESQPDQVEREVSQREIETMYQQHVRHRLPDLENRVLKTSTCLYTATPDGHFVLDHHPDSQRIVVVSACSGHGFKHSAGLGEAVAERLTLGRSQLDLSSFGLSRFAELNQQTVRT